MPCFYSVSFSVFLQSLLKKVYQESCRILTLSQRRAASSTDPHASDSRAFSSSRRAHRSEDGAVTLDQRDGSPSNPPMSWQQEKRALQETVIALRELLCRMAQRCTDVSLCGFKGTLQSGTFTSSLADHFPLCSSD